MVNLQRSTKIKEEQNVKEAIVDSNFDTMRIN
jgi:hypothetical protein